jgi:hypothetical protein
MSDCRLFLWSNSEPKAIRRQNGHLNEGKRIVRFTDTVNK